MTTKEKLKFSARLYLILSIWGVIICSLILPSPTAGLPWSLIGYVIEYLSILAGPLTGAMEYNRIPFFIACIPLSLICIGTWYALLKWEKTKPWMLIPPIFIWIAMSSWTTFWFITLRLYSA